MAKPKQRRRLDTKTPKPRTTRPTADLAATWRDRDRPAVRPLKVFAFDPGQRRTLGNFMTIEVENRLLLKGPVDVDAPPPEDPHGPPPVADLLEVIDYDATNRCFYQPVDLDDSWILMRGGLDPTEADPRFHQQMVYGVASETVRSIESALGRRIHWYRKGPGAPENIWRLRIFPHAFLQANAFYSREAKGLLFGYFPASVESPGSNLPGQMIFNCLSHDIIAHETTHAVIDGIRAHFTEPTNDDVAAFHEGFADLVALFRHFSYREALIETIRKTGGILYRFQLRAAAVAEQDKPVIVGEQQVNNPLVTLAKQFGQATGMRAGLRSALGTAPDSRNIEWTTEPHDRGAILVAAVFDAYFSVYLRRTANLFRLAGIGAGASGELPAPLADELVAAASRLADQFFRICVRAVDYCPPVDITFGDYLRALVTSDFDVNPDDGDGIREALVQSFLARRIHPQDVLSLADDSLLWPLAEPSLPRLEGLSFGTGRGLTRAEKDSNRTLLNRYVGNASTAAALRLDPALLDKKHLSIPSFHTIRRQVSGFTQMNMVVEVIQTREVPADPERPLSGTMTYRGGSVLLIDELGTVRYVIAKPIRDDQREKRQRAFLARGRAMATPPDSQDRSVELDFAAIHRGA